MARMLKNSNLHDTMLKRSAHNLPTTLLRLPPNLATLGARIFNQNILGYMEFRRFSHPEVLVKQLLAVGSRFPKIRDEIYLQIMKQLSGISLDDLAAEVAREEEDRESLKEKLANMKVTNNTVDDFGEYFHVSDSDRECMGPTRRAWVLMKACLETFSPSERLES